mmetsp:Transcript_16197/g.63159  ORF Transcript_16197/g.63159 Transcript_16197/m.63159 type:complete len:409 (-) Transcript_16197:348-1574(-)
MRGSHHQRRHAVVVLLVDGSILLEEELGELEAALLGGDVEAGVAVLVGGVPGLAVAVEEEHGLDVVLAGRLDDRFRAEELLVVGNDADDDRVGVLHVLHHRERVELLVVENVRPNHRRKVGGPHLGHGLVVRHLGEHRHNGLQRRAVAVRQLVDDLAQRRHALRVVLDLVAVDEPPVEGKGEQGLRHLAQEELEEARYDVGVGYIRVVKLPALVDLLLEFIHGILKRRDAEDTLELGRVLLDPAAGEADELGHLLAVAAAELLEGCAEDLGLAHDLEEGLGRVLILLALVQLLLLEVQVLTVAFDDGHHVVDPLVALREEVRVRVPVVAQCTQEDEVKLLVGLDEHVHGQVSDSGVLLLDGGELLLNGDLLGALLLLALLVERVVGDLRLLEVLACILRRHCLLLHEL